MEAIDLLTTRRSVLVRHMSGPGPSQDELNRIIEAGMRVPDHGKIGPWRIQIINKAGQAALGDLCAELYKEEHGERANDKMVEFERERPGRAPVLLAVTSRIEVPHNIPELEQRLSGGALCMNILNAAHALGYGAQWLTEWPAFNDEVKKMLGHDPSVDIIGFIYIGTPTQEPKPRNRPDIEAVVSEWSGPAA
ncbi:MAG: nitroreductase [Alphaproteobacteria bacterium]|nr:nitroreductase [Alphaproteobacteria bacterium]